MASGDIKGVVVNPDGWSLNVTLEGFAVGASYDYGSLGNTPADLSAPKFSVSVTSPGFDATGKPAPLNHNLIIANNRFLGQVYSGSPNVEFGIVSLEGLAVIGNVIECKGQSTSSACVWLFADTSMQTVNNCVYSHNTLAGQRSNLFYNDAYTGRANHRLSVFVRNNVFNGFAMKSDTFVHPTYGRDGSRVGNWAQMYGVAFSDNRYTYVAGYATFAQNYSGINCKYEDLTESVSNEMGFVSDASQYGTTLGGGDYTPSPSSILRNVPLQLSYQTFDQVGKRLSW